MRAIKPALLKFRFEDFASLLSEENPTYRSEERMDCNQNSWQIYFWLQNDGDDDDDATLIGFNLHCRSGPGDAKYTFTVKDATGSTFQEYESVIRFSELFAPGDGWGVPGFMKRSTILDPTKNVLKYGALCVELTIQVMHDSDEFYDPKEVENYQDKMLQLLDNQEKADVSVKVGEKVFHLHSLILDNNAPLLAAHCKQFNETNNVVGDIDPKVFRMILQYVYSGYCPYNDDILTYGKELIDAANRFELVKLKLAIEREIVCERILNKQNVCDYILFADAQSCPLLKEYAISYFLLHRKEILKSDHSKHLRESSEVLSDIMIFTADQDENEMTVNELREKLSLMGLDVDGSKEALISRLEEAMRQLNEGDGLREGS